MVTQIEIDQMSIEQIDKNKAYIEHMELEFAPSFRHEYLAYCKKVDEVERMSAEIKDTERKMAFNAGRLMARDSGMSYTEICQHVSEIEEKARIRLLHNGLVGDEIECTVSSMMLPEMLNGAKCEFRMSDPRTMR